MRSLADRIESYLKVLIERSEDDEVAIQRIELAETFRCAPSQITYVLGTRFTLEEGFVTESKRGGRGFIRIRKVSPVKPGISQAKAERIISEMEAVGILTNREALILKAIINSEVLDLETTERAFIRYRIMDTVLKLMEGYEDVL